MNKKIRQKNKAFTIIEALVAIMILSISVGGMLGVTASSATSARYANNEITANYLLQEAVDSVRNSRDTIAFQMKDTTGGWPAFLNRYGYGAMSKCFTTNGCVFRMDSFDASDLSGNDIVPCPNSGCPSLSYDSLASSQLFYQYSTGNPSSFVRTVKMVVTPTNPDTNTDEVKVTATVNWLNGSSSLSRSLEIYLLNWQK